MKNAKENYINSLKDLKRIVDNQTKSMLEQISEKAMNRYFEYVNYADEGVKSKLRFNLDEIIKAIKKSFEQIQIRRIVILINQFKSNLEEISKGKGEYNFPFLIEDEIFKEEDILTEKFSIDINVLSQNSENINDEYELEITPYFKTKIDLSGIQKGEFRLISINFDKTIEDFGKSTFTLKILKKDEQVSNDLKLTFKLKELNAVSINEDLFE